MFSQPGKPSPSSAERIAPNSALGKILPAIFCFVAATAAPLAAQSTSSPLDRSDHLSGTVVNAATHEPIPRALVYSPDNRYAVMTDGRGRFEFEFPRNDAEDSRQNANVSSWVSFNGSSRLQVANPNRPNMLMARKPGFVPRNDGEDQVQLAPEQQEITLTLTPEAKIVGHVNVPGADGSDNIQVSLYRRQIQDGRARWQPAGSVTARSDGEFRFAELQAGSYKLFTNEIPDSDPLASSPRRRRLGRAIFSSPSGQSFGYPPVYYPAASDFGAAGIVTLSPGETFQANLSPERREYYAVKLPVANTTGGGNVEVWPAGHAGPGYSLSFNPQDGAIEGMLPNGSYIVRFSTYGQDGLNDMGFSNITVSGAPVSGPAVTVLPNTTIAVEVREEFQNQTQAPVRAELPMHAPDDADAVQQNARHPNYLQVFLEPDEELDSAPRAWLRPPQSPDDDSLIITNVFPGRYHVRVTSGMGFVSSMVCGGTDLLRQPLVVGQGATVPPIEITVRDDGAQVDGTVIASSNTPSATLAQRLPGIVYFIPVSTGGGTFTQTWFSQEGAFTVQQLPPGEYRVLAFDRQQPEFEYEREEALSRYDSKSQLIHVAPGDKQHLRLSLITAAETRGSD